MPAAYFGCMICCSHTSGDDSSGVADECCVMSCSPLPGNGLTPGVQQYTGLACSPHRRGWSQVRRPARHLQQLLPAPAGMVPPPTVSAGRGAAAPCARGDGPMLDDRARARLDCSPHLRGWSRVVGHRQDQGALLPTPAGMVPGGWPAERPGAPVPRTCGDGPAMFSDGAEHLRCSLHTRRDGPLALSTSAVRRPCSPHPRGWSPVQAAGRQRGRPAPRTRGDGPLGQSVQKTRRGLLPTPVGMVPSSRSPHRTTRAAPRARGDGPRGLGSVV